ncbi:hypothetical protein GCM10011391_19860 [Pullulanibacillus camelliae]|uniref:Uncharacterized protein n=1 Tax=Pullulanibacillus camelliae TaxID=1707096 RepID=A0A8J2VT06_9BACL|nr:hypothetical protein GCM10011391_19860 [Pullulanibacillus camelliae]
MKLLNDRGVLSSDTGEFIFREFDEKIGFSQTLIQHLQLNSVFYIIRLKFNVILQSLAKELHPNSMPSDISKTKEYADSNDTDKDH